MGGVPNTSSEVINPRGPIVSLIGFIDVLRIVLLDSFLYLDTWFLP